MKYGSVSDQVLSRLGIAAGGLGHLTPRQARKAVSRILAELIELVLTLPEDEVLCLQGFGKFLWKKRPARTHWNMFTKQVESVPPSVALVFEPARGLRRKA